jgi:type IV pilus assembly protein PilC
LKEAEDELKALLEKKKTIDEKVSLKKIVQQDFPGLSAEPAYKPVSQKEKIAGELKSIREKAIQGRYRFISSFLVKDHDMLLFTRQFYYMITSGVPIAGAIKVLYENQENATLRSILRDIQRDVAAGTSITRAFSRFSEIFNPAYLAMIQIGEESGKLDQAFRSILAFQEKDFEMKRKVGSSLVYPCVILLMAFVLMVAMVFYFVPVFMKIFESMHLALPVPTRILIFTVKALQRPEVIFLLFNLLILGIVAFVVSSRTAAGSRTIDRLKLAVPMVGPTILQIALARFARSFSMMTAAGVPIIRAFSVIMATTDLSCLKDAIGDFAERVREGIAFSNVQLDSRVFPKLFISFLKAGEESGSLPGTMERLAEIYEEDIALRLEAIVGLIEPFFLTVVSFVVGYVLIAVFLPLYGVLNSLGG